MKAMAKDMEEKVRCAFILKNKDSFQSRFCRSANVGEVKFIFYTLRQPGLLFRPEPPLEIEGIGRFSDREFKAIETNYDDRTPMVKMIRFIVNYDDFCNALRKCKGETIVEFLQTDSKGGDLAISSRKYEETIPARFAAEPWWSEQ
jgi:hypothetical protein